MTSRAALLDFLSTTLLATPDDLVGAGFTHAQVRRAVEAGDVVRFERGVYGLPATYDTDLLDYAVATVANGGRDVVCLMSACMVHALGNEMPKGIWMADAESLRGRFVSGVRWRGPALTVGVEVRRVAGVNVRFTNPARSVVDMLRFVGRFGWEPAMIPLHDYVNRGLPIMDLWDVADGLGCLKAFEPYYRCLEEFAGSLPGARMK